MEATVLTRDGEARVIGLDGRDAVRVHVTRIEADYPAGRIVGRDTAYEGLDAADHLGRLVDALAADGWEERPWIAGYVFGECGHRIEGAVVLAGHTKCGGC